MDGNTNIRIVLELDPAPVTIDQAATALRGRVSAVVNGSPTGRQVGTAFNSRLAWFQGRLALVCTAEVDRDAWQTGGEDGGFYVGEHQVMGLGE